MKVEIVYENDTFRIAAWTSIERNIGRMMAYLDPQKHTSVVWTVDWP